MMERMREILHHVFANVDEARTRMLRLNSPFGHLKGWKLSTFIVKAGDDVRQEALAMQVISLVDRIWRREGLRLWLRPYAIACVGHEAGLVECITDARSVDEIKKRTPGYVSMQDYFERLYMGPGAGLYGRAQDNFVRSLAGYSVVTYLLQVKDRHNANIMLDTRGHIIHIDFGFILGASPGLWTHETAPFKLTSDYIDIMGGVGSVNWVKFQELFLAGFRAVQKNINDIAALVQVMMPANDRRTLIEISKLKKRFSDLKTDEEILGLIKSSANSVKTWQYDYIQSLQNGIAM
ncbi:pi 4-kinase [Tribonema minus]|uniref:Pi 4-kinase n=1 Tax=Tribonema minus TaxID=303371 RepID=A0A835ZKD2_9STRA|nr:pi 4-kinase [Tribonema minus]